MAVKTIFLAFKVDKIGAVLLIHTFLDCTTSAILLIYKKLQFDLRTVLHYS